MKVTIFAIFWFVALAYAFLSNRPGRIIKLTLTSMVMQAPAIFVFDDFDVGAPSMASLMLVIWYIYNRVFRGHPKLRIYAKDSYKRKMNLACYFLVITILVSYYVNAQSYIISQYKFWMYFFQLFIYIICVLCVNELQNELSNQQIKDYFVFTIKVVVVTGVIQYANTLGLINLNGILRTLLYNGIGTSYSLRYGSAGYPWGQPRLFSTFMEPSYCSAFLVGAFYYLLADDSKSRREYWLTILVLLEIFLTFSSTAYGALAVAGVIYLLMSKDKKKLVYLVPVGVVGIMALAISGEGFKILNSVILSKLQTGSGVTRTRMNLEAMGNFRQSPLLGAGYKNCRGSSLWFSLLGQLGLAGVAWICGLSIYNVWYALKTKSDKVIVAGVLFLMSVLAALIIAIPDIDFCVLWLAMYLLVLFVPSSPEKEREFIS